MANNPTITFHFLNVAITKGFIMVEFIVVEDSLLSLEILIMLDSFMMFALLEGTTSLKSAVNWDCACIRFKDHFTSWTIISYNCAMKALILYLL